MDRKTELLLMAIRCEYVSIPSMKLSKKGKGFFNPAKWRLINDAKCLVDSKWKNDMSELILSIDKVNKVNELYPSKKE